MLGRSRVSAITQKAAKPMATTTKAAAARPSHFKTRERKFCMEVRAYNKAGPRGLPEGSRNYREAWEERENWASTASAIASATLLRHESVFIWAASPLLDK